jgi:hypothetical protein
MRNEGKHAVAAAWLAAALLAGCASTPQASLESDAEAKQFLTHPGSATIYVYRDDFAVGSIGMQDSTLYLNGRLVGMTLQKSFYRVNARPGVQLLQGFAYDQGKLQFDVRAGQAYFVSLRVTDGTSHFALVDPERGKRDITRCCALLENWAPGQRPFLY